MPRLKLHSFEVAGHASPLPAITADGGRSLLAYSQSSHPHAAVIVAQHRRSMRDRSSQKRDGFCVTSAATSWLVRNANQRHLALFPPAALLARSMTHLAPATRPRSMHPRHARLPQIRGRVRTQPSFTHETLGPRHFDREAQTLIQVPCVHACGPARYRYHRTGLLSFLRSTTQTSADPPSALLARAHAAPSASRPANLHGCATISGHPCRDPEASNHGPAVRPSRIPISSTLKRMLSPPPPPWPKLLVPLL